MKQAQVSSEMWVATRPLMRSLLREHTELAKKGWRGHELRVSPVGGTLLWRQLAERTFASGGRWIADPPTILGWPLIQDPTLRPREARLVLRREVTAVEL
jgi:hypothetical protein